MLWVTDRVEGGGRVLVCKRVSSTLSRHRRGGSSWKRECCGEDHLTLLLVLPAQWWGSRWSRGGLCIWSALSRWEIWWKGLRCDLGMYVYFCFSKKSCVMDDVEMVERVLYMVVCSALSFRKILKRKVSDFLKLSISRLSMLIFDRIKGPNIQLVRWWEWRELQGCVDMNGCYRSESV